MLNEKLLTILSHPVDGCVSIVTNSSDGPHLVNTWNSYIEVTPNDKLLVPVSGFVKTERNLSIQNEVIISIASREVAGYKGIGTGFIVKGNTHFIKDGEDFNRMKEKFSWIRAVLEITVTSAKQML